MTHRFTSTASDDLDDGARYYERQQPGLGAQFIDTVLDAVEHVVLFPYTWSRIDEKYFRFQIKIFPYFLIFFVSNGSEVVVLSVYLCFTKNARPIAGGIIWNNFENFLIS